MFFHNYIHDIMSSTLSAIQLPSELSSTDGFSRHSSTACICQSVSELLHNWHFTAKQFVMATSLLRPTTRIFIFQLNNCDYSPYVPSSLKRGQVCRLHLLLGVASAVRVPRNICPHFTVSDSRLPKTGGPGSLIYIPQEQGGPVIS
jgi:hypothetical protein